MKAKAAVLMSICPQRASDDRPATGAKYELLVLSTVLAGLAGRLGRYNRIIRRSAFVTFFAIERVAQHLLSAFGRNDPGPVGPRRIMAGVLIVAAGKLCDPIIQFVPVKSGNHLLHCFCHNT